MEFRHEIQKKPLPQSQKSTKIVLFAILILIAISGYLLFNKILYDSSVYSYNPQVNGKKYILFR